MKNRAFRFCWNSSNRILVWKKIIAAIALASLLGLTCPFVTFSQVPVRLSFKFILNASGNRPATGDLNTDTQVYDQVARGNRMLSNHVSELAFQTLEIVNVPGISQWYGAEPEETWRDDLRQAARNNPVAYHWRQDAVNIYVSNGIGTNSGGIAKFPPDNDIILLPQNVLGNVVAHEVGHILNLKHTHEDCFGCGGDSCDDTLPDNADWTRDDIANNAFGVPYNQLNPGQQQQVDLVWFNVMSYHNGDTAFQLSSCQLDRMSNQADSDQDWLLSRLPVYVVSWWPTPYGNGRFYYPFQTIQQAMDANALAGRTLVLSDGTHARPASPINTTTVIVPRKGSARVRCRPVSYSLPQNLEESTNAAVKAAVRRVQESDRGRDSASAIANLHEAEKHATGREKSALQLELARRYRDSKQYDLAVVWFQKTAEGTDQPGLLKRASESAAAMKVQAQKQRDQKPSDQRGNNTK